MISTTSNHGNSIDSLPSQSIIVILNRWSDDFALYHEYIDHTTNQVIYFTTLSGRKALKEFLASCIYELESFSNIDILLKLCREVILNFGRIDRIIALSEYDLESAAILRDSLGIEGVNTKQVKLYKDKVTMKLKVQQAGLQVPNFIDCLNPENPINFSKQYGFPLILKPRVGAAGRGIYSVLSSSELYPLLKSIDINHYECEEYIAGVTLHVDGLVINKEIIFFKASKYINNCLAFNWGVPLGSVMIDEPSLNKRIFDFTSRTLDTLELNSGAFHLELIHNENDDLVFLELNARVGGAEITFLVKDLFSIDIVGAWVGIQMQKQVPNFVCENHVVGGWLVIPEPQEVPCSVISCSSLIGKVPGLYKEIIPSIGEIFWGDGEDVHVSGRFRFRGQNSKEVEESIFQTLSLFSIETSPVSM